MALICKVLENPFGIPMETAYARITCVSVEDRLELKQDEGDTGEVLIPDSFVRKRVIDYFMAVYANKEASDGFKSELSTQKFTIDYEGQVDILGTCYDHFKSIGIQHIGSLKVDCNGEDA